MLVVKKLSKIKTFLLLNSKSQFFFKLKNYFGMLISKFENNNNPKSYNF